MEFKGSKTEANLMYAFSGESQARNKYSYYASKARKEGYEQIAAIFEQTANNEKEHAKLWFKAFHGIGTTYENLLDPEVPRERERWGGSYEAWKNKVQGLKDFVVKENHLGYIPDKLKMYMGLTNSEAQKYFSRWD